MFITVVLYGEYKSALLVERNCGLVTIKSLIVRVVPKKMY